MMLLLAYLVGGIVYFLGSTAFCVRVHRPHDSYTDEPWSDQSVVINCGVQSLFWPAVLPFALLGLGVWLGITLGKKWVAVLTPPESATGIGGTPQTDSYLSEAAIEVEAILLDDKYKTLDPKNEITFDIRPTT